MVSEVEVLAVCDDAFDSREVLLRRAEHAFEPAFFVRIYNNVGIVTIGVIFDLEIINELDCSGPFHHPMDFHVREHDPFNHLLCIRKDYSTHSSLIPNQFSNTSTRLKLELTFNVRRVLQ